MANSRLPTPVAYDTCLRVYLLGVPWKLNRLRLKNERVGRGERKREKRKKLMCRNTVIASAASPNSIRCDRYATIGTQLY